MSFKATVFALTAHISPSTFFVISNQSKSNQKDNLTLTYTNVLSHLMCMFCLKENFNVRR